MDDLIKMAGGLTINANKKDIHIKYANGVSKKYNRLFSNHKIYDGSVIYIGKKEEEEPFDTNEYLKDLTSIFANLAQVISLILIAKS